VFAGHLGVGLALKKAAPELNLGVLLFASLFLDVLLGFLVLAGIEKVIVPDTYSQLHYLNFSFPYSHSLLAVVVWSLVAFGVARTGWLGGTGAKLKASVAISAAVLFHWICDWIEHPPQLPVAGDNSRMLGLGLWNDLEIALALEVLLVIAGTAIYLRTAKRIGRSGRWGILLLMVLLTAVAVTGQATVTQAPEQNAIAVSMIVQALVVCGLAVWIDRNREGSPISTRPAASCLKALDKLKDPFLTKQNSKISCQKN